MLYVFSVIICFYVIVDDVVIIVARAIPCLYKVFIFVTIREVFNS